MRRPAGEVTAELFPERLVINAMGLPLEYHFEPGTERDGVTLVVPAAVLNQVDQGRADWLVPGLLREKIIALIKGLPKSLRRNFVPAPDYAERVFAALVDSAGRTDTPLVQRVGAELKRLTGVHVPEDAWDESALPEHLRLRLRVIDAEGRTLAAGRDLAALRRGPAGDGAAASTHTLPDSGLGREGLKDWDFGSLPEQVAIEEGGIPLQGFPALVDCGDSVALRVLDSRPNAERAHRAGLRRLFMLRLAKDVRYLRRNLPGLQQMRLQYAKAAQPEDSGSTPADLEEEIVSLVIDLSFIEDQPPVRERDGFERRIAERRGRMSEVAGEACALLGRILAAYQQLRKTLSGITQSNWLSSVQDMQAQLDQLVYRGFLQQVSFAHLRDYPRYLQALQLRADKLRHAAARDQQRMRELQPLLDRWRQRCSDARDKGRRDPRLEEIGWMLQELRVSFFAQEIKTAYPVSVKRVERRWRELGL
jgi:ATP-dependent helicase HrpA